MNIEELTEALFASVETFIARRLLEVETRCASLEAQLKAALADREKTQAAIQDAVKAALFDFRKELEDAANTARSLKASVEVTVAALPSPETIITSARQVAEQAIAALPKPEPIDVTRLESSMKEFCLATIEALPKPKDGEKGEPGASVTVEALVGQLGPEVVKLVGAQVTEAVAGLPKPKDGKDAESVDYDRIEETIARHVGEATVKLVAPEVDYKRIIDQCLGFIKGAVADEVALIPKPENGKDGAAGAPGKDGVSVDPAMVSKMVEDAVAAIEIVVPDPIPGKDGTSVSIDEVKEFVSAEIAKQVLALPVRKEVDFAAVQALVDVAVKSTLANLPPAPAGKDGFSPDNLSLTLGEDERTLTVTLSAEGREPIHRSLMLPMTIARGTYDPSVEYNKGDIAVFDGSSWVAKQRTQDVPGTSKSWQLLAQRGRNGRDREAPTPAKEPTQVRLK